MFSYSKADIINGEVVITESRMIDQSTLTSDCWSIQFAGLSACTNCEFLDTDECGGINIRAKLLKQD